MQNNLFKTYDIAHKLATGSVNTARIADAAQDAGQSSAGIVSHNPMDETMVGFISEVMMPGVQSALTNEIFGVLYASSQIKDPALRQAMQGQLKEQVRLIVQKYEERAKNDASVKAMIRKFVEDTKKGMEILRRIFGAKAASSKGVSSQEQSAMDAITNSFIARNDEPPVNIVDTHG